MILMFTVNMCRFLVGVGWNVKDLRHYSLRTKHLQMKVCSILLISRQDGLPVLVCFILTF